MMLLLFFATLSWSQQPSSPADLWIQIYEGRLTEAMESNHEYAIEIYSALLENLSPDHPVYGELMFWKGEAQFRLGDYEGAKVSILNSYRDDRISQQADRFLEEIEAWERRVTTLPYEGTPWIILNHRKDNIETWYARLDGNVRTPIAIGIQVSLEESEDAYIDIIDWEGKRWSHLAKHTQQIQWFNPKEGLVFLDTIYIQTIEIRSTIPLQTPPILHLK